MPVPIDLISIIFPHQLIQIRDNDTDPCPGQSRLAANIRKLVYKNISSLTRRANLPACAQKQRRAHGLQTQCGEKCPVFLHLNVQSQLKSNDLSYIHYWKMPGSHSLNFLGMCSCRRPLDSAPIGLCYICQCRRVSLSFFKPWNLAGCQLYTVHMACHWPPGVYSS